MIVAISLINCALMWTRRPERATEPSTTASTRSAVAISGSDWLECLNCMTDVRNHTDALHARQAFDQCFGHP